MDFATILSVTAVNVALIGWMRNDSRHFQSELKADQRSFQNEIRGWKDEINKEMKDFHGRLCSIEERQKQNG